MANAVAMFQYCPSVAIKVIIIFDLFSNVIFSLDNGRNSDIYKNVIKGKVRLINNNKVINNYNLYYIHHCYYFISDIVDIIYYIVY